MTITTPAATAAEILRSQARVERTLTDLNARLTTAERGIRTAADRIDALANGLKPPMNTIHITRQQLHEIAEILRAGARHG